MSWVRCHAKTAIDEDKLILHRNVVHVPFGANPIRRSARKWQKLWLIGTVSNVASKGHVLQNQKFSVRESLHSWRISRAVHAWWVQGICIGRGISHTVQAWQIQRRYIRTSSHRCACLCACTNICIQIIIYIHVDKHGHFEESYFTKLKHSSTPVIQTSTRNLQESHLNSALGNRMKRKALSSSSSSSKIGLMAGSTLRRFTSPAQRSDFYWVGYWRKPGVKSTSRWPSSKNKLTTLEFHQKDGWNVGFI